MFGISTRILATRSLAVRVCLSVVVAYVLSGCTVLYSLLSTGEPKFQLDLKSIAGMPVVTEEEFILMIAERRYGPVSSDDRRRATAVSALLNEPNLLGIELEGAWSPNAGPAVFIVARSMETDATGKPWANDLYVAAAAGLQLPSRHRVVARVTSAIGTEQGADVSPSAPVECILLPAQEGAPSLDTGERGAGVAGGARINAESSATRVNAGRRTVELLVYPFASSELPANRFACGRAHVRSHADATLPAAGTARWPVMATAALISEDDYRLWAGLPGLQRHALPRAEDAKQAARIVAAANHPDARAIEARVHATWPLLPAMQLPSLLVVARDLKIEGDRARATQYFVVPSWWDRPRGWPLPIQTSELFIDFGNHLPWFDTDAAMCGPVMLPGRRCESGPCTQLPHWNPLRGNLGTDRLLSSLNRATLHWETAQPAMPTESSHAPASLWPPERPSRRAFDVNVAACSMMSPPLPQPALYCGINVLTGRPIEEVCNGRDDNCDGQIDEAPACDLKHLQQCPGQPRTCGLITCGMIPDGCGNVVTCGGPCP